MIALAALLALGDQYLTREQALKLVFPNGERVLERVVELNEAERARVEERYGGSVSPRQTLFVGARDGAVTGFAMILTEITKTLPATFIVSVSPEGSVTEVAVMSHEDHIGTDCRRKRFLDQFRGKTNGHQITVPNGGIQKVSGATLSCQSVARGVRKAVAIVQVRFVERPESARALVQEEPVRQKRYVMGAFCEIVAEGDAKAVERAFGEMRRLEKVLSNYDEQSELSRLVREGSLEAGPDLLSFLGESRKYSELTEGAFDVTVAPLVRLWGFKDGKHRVPGEAEIRGALGLVGWKRVEIEGGRVRLAKGTELDPGAIGKGIAVDAAAGALRKAGVKRALVDFGSSAVAIGRWEMDIRDPFREGKVLGTVLLEDESLSTSGSYEKFFKADGTTYSHILDPRTGRPARGTAGVSVVARTGTESDAMSTATFVRGELPAHLPALRVAEDGGVRMNEAFAKKFRKAAE
jgi:thiamine biosynthesis lipoprotein